MELEIIYVNELTLFVLFVVKNEKKNVRDNEMNDFAY